VNAAGENVEERSRARVRFTNRDDVNVVTGVSVLDHLLTLVARYGGFALELEVAPTAAEAEVASAGQALGQALHDVLHHDRATGHGSALVPADEALAHIALVISDRPRVVANVDLSDARIAGLGTDLVASFMRELAEAAGLTLHVRLIEGEDAQHVLETIFMGLGAALAQASRPRDREER
jgi:imidazoleglycerol-phosphate dehydratase